MKRANRLTKKDQPKSDLTGNKEGESSTTNGGSGTPEITARSRQSLSEYSGNRENGNEQETERVNELFLQQEKELIELKEALRESQNERQATSMAYQEMSKRLSNSIPITPGPNINKPRMPRPQDAAYQAVMQLKEKNEQGQESEATNEGNEMLRLFSHLTNTLKDTSKSDVNLPPKIYGDDDKWEGWYKQWRTYLQAKEWSRRF
jgi:hypothetical protein